MADPNEDAEAYAEVRKLGAELSNWGRWGDDDEIGTLNLVTPAAIRRGAAAVRDGVGFCLGLELGHDGPHTNALFGRFNPQHYMTAIGQPVAQSPFFRWSDDVIVMPLNAATQWDSLAHVYYEDALYNGHSPSSLTETGAARNGIDKQAAHPFATRGLLADVARARGVDRLPPDAVIDADELDRILGAANLTPEQGDVLLVRTGHVRAFLVEGDRDSYNGASPGIGMSVLPWLRRHDIAAIASDTVTVEVNPSEDGRTICPVHLVAIRDMGLLLGEMFDLEALAEYCAERERWEFQFVAPPLPITGGISSPLNPVAVC